MSDDYYSILGVQRSASDAEIQKAYRVMARKHHPDLNPEDRKAKERFQAVQRAYEVLSDPKKRELYDRYGSSFDTAGSGGGRGGGGGWQRTGAGGPQFDDLDIDLSEIFGGRHGGDPGGGFADLFKQFTRAAREPGRRGQRREAGRDVQHELTIPFQTAVRGGQAQLVVHRGPQKSETISVKIPAGIEDGKKIRLRNQGEPGRGGERGDLLITVRVSPHPFFQRRGQQLELKLPVTLREAVDGASIDVPGPRGTISLKIPPGTSSGKKLRIRGHGVGADNTSAGDLLVEIQIVLPSRDKMKPADVEAIRNLDWGPPDPRRELQW